MLVRPVCINYTIICTNLTSKNDVEEVGFMRNKTDLASLHAMM